MKIFSLPCVCALAFSLSACSSSSSSGTGAEAYAEFGRLTEQAVPDGLKIGGANTSVSVKFAKDLSGACAVDYTDCPPITYSGGADGEATEILMRLWSLDYNNECLAARFTNATCFDCVDCQTGVGTTHFIKPRIFEDPDRCSDSYMAHYVNLGIDPCFFDSIIVKITNIEPCMAVEGGAVDISPVIPWYASWGLPQTIYFSGFYAHEGSDGGIWWTINNGPRANQRYFLSLDSNWLYSGIKDFTGDRFIFVGTGSPAYNQAAATTGGYTTGVSISAYAGTISTIPRDFETVQIRVQDPHKYIERLKAKSAYLWYQRWSGSDFPNLPSDVATVKDNPSLNRCFHIGGGIPLSLYVPLAECVTAFEKTSVAELNQDANYILKVVDGQTASAIDFSSILTPTTTTTSCLPPQ